MIPYKCPICDGHGIVPGGFYFSTGGRSISTNSTEPCRACGGTGILWGDGPSPVYGGEFRYEEDEETGHGSPGLMSTWSRWIGPKGETIHE